MDSKTIAFRALADSNVDLSLVDTGGAFNVADTSQTVDFGNLSAGTQRSYDTVIRSNDGYSVTFQSQNAQKLKHTVKTDTVSYTMTFGGSSVNLSGGGVVNAATSNGVTPATGDRFATQFTIGAMTGAETAGNYQDVLTVTVSAH